MKSVASGSSQIVLPAMVLLWICAPTPRAAVAEETLVVGWGAKVVFNYGVTNPPTDLTNAVAVAGGGQHSLALRSDGTVTAWGDNASRQCSVPAGLGQVVAIAAGDSHSLALRNDGTVVAWGQASTTNMPAGLTNVVGIAGGYGYSMALKSDGTVSSWGYGTVTNMPASLTNGISVACGRAHGLVLRADGTVAAWGDNSGGQCNVPAGLSGVVAVAGGYSHSLALKADGTLVAWGQAIVPSGLSNVAAIACTSRDNAVLQTDGSIVAWGRNAAGETNVPPGLTNAGAITCGKNFGLVITGTWSPRITRPPGSLTVFSGHDATLSAAATGTPPLCFQWQRGGTNLPGSTNPVLILNAVQAADAGHYSVVVSNVYGTAVSGSATLSVTEQAPFLISQPTNLVVFAGARAVFSVAAHGSRPLCYQWRRNGVDLPAATNSSLVLERVWPGNEGFYTVVVSNAAGTEESASAHLGVVKVVGWGLGLMDSPPINATGVVQIACGGFHNLALRSDGTVVAWGQNGAGQTNVPAGLNGIAQVSGGWMHSLALKADGTVLGWGRGNSGETNVPPDLSNVVQIAADGRHNLALRSDGTVAAWGENVPGANEIPAGLAEVVAVDAGSAHNLVLKEDGTVRAWGDNSYGQAQVPEGLSNVVAIAACATHSMALLSDGTVVDWGGTNYGLPSVPLDLTNAVAIEAGAYFALALKGDGTVVAWGTGSSPDQTNVPPGLSNVVAIAADGIHSLALMGDGAPHITVQPWSRTVCVGRDVDLNVMSVGIPPLCYQWQKNGMNLVGETNTLLHLSQVTRGDSGVYSVSVSNVLGGVVSRNAILAARLRPRLSLPEFPPGNGTVVYASSDCGIALEPADLSCLEAQASSNLVDWFVLPDALTITDGVLRVHDPGGAHWPARFYRVVER